MDKKTPQQDEQKVSIIWVFIGGFIGLVVFKAIALLF